METLKKKKGKPVEQRTSVRKRDTSSSFNMPSDNFRDNWELKKSIKEVDYASKNGRRL